MSPARRTKRLRSRKTITPEAKKRGRFKAREGGPGGTPKGWNHPLVEATPATLYVEHPQQSQALEKPEVCQKGEKDGTQRTQKQFVPTYR